MKEITQIKTESWIKAALYGLLLVGIFYTSHRVMVIWWGNEDYTYCYLIAPIVLYLIWEKREELANVQVRPSWSGLMPLAFKEHRCQVLICDFLDSRSATGC